MFALVNSIHNIHAFNHLTEYGMNAIQMRLWFINDEELRPPCVRTTMGHRKGAANVLVWIANKFIFDCIARAACTIPIRTATLRYESRDNTVEG